MKGQSQEEFKTKKTVRDWVHRIKKIIELSHFSATKCSTAADADAANAPCVNHPFYKAC